MSLVRPYGDTRDDGALQLSFTLPIAWSEAADEAARQLAVKMGFTDVSVVERVAVRLDRAHAVTGAAASASANGFQ